MTGGMSRGEYSTRGRSDRALDTIAETLAAAAHLAPDGRGRLLARHTLAGWPGIVHGGGLVALLDGGAIALGGVALPRVVDARLIAPVPIDTALILEGHAADDAVRLSVLQDGRTLTSSAISALDPRAASPATAWRGGDDGSSLPMSEHCLACGALNPLGLQARLRFDDAGVWARLEPRAPWRDREGRPHPALAPVLLDEIAWWLGALVAKEGGLTNRIRLTLWEPDARWSAPLTAAGRFDAVTPMDKQRIFWRTETALTAADGTLVATASVVFRGGVDYSAPQMAYFRPRTPPEVFSRMFPNYAR